MRTCSLKQLRFKGLKGYSFKDVVYPLEMVECLKQGRISGAILWCLR